FRWRSYLPLVLLPLFVLSLRDDRPPAPFSFELFCFAIALSGLCVRAIVIGAAPPGTSARGTTQPTADQLNTLGAYSIVRHPLYLANTLIWLGCALLSGTWYLPVIVALVSFIYHERIAAREEAFLLQRLDRKSTRLNSSHSQISYAVFCLKKKKKTKNKLQKNER